MFKAGIFDAGGVLQTYEVMESIFEDIVQTLKISRAEFDQVWEKYHDYLSIGEWSEDKFWQFLLKETGSRQKLPEESLLLRQYKKKFQINQQVLEIVKKLKARGIKLAILTNTMDPHTDFNTEMGLYDDFEVKIFSNRVGIKKPDPRIYQICLDKLQVLAKEAFMVDDKERNLKPAEALGITGILFTTPKQLKKDLENLGLL